MTESERKKRLAAVREWLQQANIDAVFFTNEDAHHSEFSGDWVNIRKQLLGFEGSAGNLALFRKGPQAPFQAAFWVDGRYHLEAEKLLAHSEVTLFKLGLPGVLPPEQWLPAQLAPNALFFIDENTLSEAAFHRWQAALAARSVHLTTQAAGFPPFPSGFSPAFSPSPIEALPPVFCGETLSQKLTQLKKLADAHGVRSCLISQLDTLAGLFNARGSDIPESLLFEAHFLWSPTRKLLIAPGELSPSLAALLSENKIERLKAFPDLASLDLSPFTPLTADPETTARLRFRLFDEAGLPLFPCPDFFKDLAEYRAIRRPNEIKGLRLAHRVDALALHMLKTEVQAALLRRGSISEREIASLSSDCRRKALEQLRRPLNLPAEARYIGPSFAPIVAAGANAAEVHYRPSETHPSFLHWNEPLLLDTGGQYTFGTTDVTRVFYFTPAPQAKTAAESGDPRLKTLRHDYTLVLKGHLALQAARFPKGTTGTQLDTLTRTFLWAEGKDFLHGSGHGVGFALNVHEGPQSLSPRTGSHPLKAGMVVTDEPGFYRSGHYGIRIENMLLITEDPHHPDFLQFEPLTLFPYETALIDNSLLTETEAAAVADFNRKAELITGNLSQFNDNDTIKHGVSFHSSG